MLDLSVALATFNEEDSLDRCLSSVSGWVSEIVLVDGGSTDRTVEIAKKYGAQILHVSNQKNFHINKQKAIDACRCAWIFQLDADEIIGADLREEIQGLLSFPSQQQRSHGHVHGYWVSRKNYFLSRWLRKGGQYPDWTLRLYRKGEGRLPCRSVHEQAEVAGETRRLRHALLHYPYPNFSHYLEHFDRYTSLLSQEIVSPRPIPARLFLSYLVIRPFGWFFSTYFRHRGYADGFPGFVFSLFSSLRFPVAFIKHWESLQERT